MRPFDPATQCGSPGRRCKSEPPTCRHEDGDHRCRLFKGFGTDHVGSMHCKWHGGNSPNGRKAAARETAERAIAKLGLPMGSGDPFTLLTKAVQHAEGYLEATAQLVQDSADTVEKAGGRPRVDLTVAAEFYEQAVRTAARTGKAAVDADVADRLAALDERAGSLLLRFVRELLERVVPAAKRPALEAWASGRLAELAHEYEHAPVAVH